MAVSRGLPLPVGAPSVRANPTFPQRLTAVVHRRAATGGAACGFFVLLPSPFPPFTVCARSLFEVSQRGSGAAAFFKENVA